MAGRPLRPATRRSLGRPLPHQQADRPRAHLPPKNFPPQNMRPKVISSISSSFPLLSQSERQVAHVLLTRSPLIHGTSTASSFDLHVLSTPPAFVLSQDQTLRKNIATPKGVTTIRNQNWHQKTANTPNQNPEHQPSNNNDTAQPNNPTTTAEPSSHTTSHGINYQTHY